MNTHKSFPQIDNHATQTTPNPITMNNYEYTTTDVLTEDWIDSLLVEDEERHIENFDDTINDTLK